MKIKIVVKVVIGLAMLAATIYIIMYKHLMNIIFSSPNLMRQTLCFCQGHKKLVLGHT